MRRTPRALPALLALLALLLLPGAGEAASSRKEREARIATLPAKYQAWIAEVELLMSDEEIEMFLGLEEDYQRDAFVERFWAARDPYPNTARNELKDKWDARVDEARNLFGNLREERSRMYLLNGAPNARIEVTCTGTLWPSEVWYYAKNERLPDELLIVFYQKWGRGEYVIWQPIDGVGALFQFGEFGANEGQLLSQIQSSCRLDQSDALVAAIVFARRAGQLDYPLRIMRALAPPDPASGEWVATFASYSTDLPPDAATFPAEVTFGFPGRHQARTVVQGSIAVDRAALGVAELGGARSLNVLLTGEIVQDGSLFDRFRYKFDLPLGEVAAERVPFVFQRYLRPGSYDLVLKLEDLNGSRYFRAVETIEVPAVEAAPPPPTDPETARLMAEANAAISRFDNSLTLLEPVQDMLVGLVRFDAQVTGTGVASVEFALDGKPILKKTTAPWSVELDLGRLPRTQVLRAEARDATGELLAADEMLVNASAHRFSVSLTQPRPGEHFERSLRAVAEVEVPEGQRVERVELFLDETPVATLYQPPYDQPITLPEPGQLAYVRAVAYLPDGNSTEDHVFVNAPPGLEEIDIQLVELYTSVTDRAGRPVDGLEQAAFSVVEDEVPQEIRRFERVRDLPFHAAILLDVSASMEPRMAQAQSAALSFFQDTVTPKDRAALITFNDRPQLVTKFTNRLLDLGGGLAGLKAERGTAVWDSVIFSLYYFNGVKGQRALLVLSDGQDESSRFGFDDALEFARRAGVTVYTVGLDLPRKEREARKHLERLAAETGGRSFFIEDAAELAGIYRTIEEELRSQYLIAYQSTNSSPDGKFRTVELEVQGDGLEAKTIRGYYP